MKVLWKNGEHEIVIADENNYDLNRCWVGKNKDCEKIDCTANIGHFNKLQHAVKRACELRANNRCEDLKSWMTEYKASLAYFDKIFN